MIEMMEDKPKPSKSKYDASQKVYERDHYIILQVKSGKKIGYIAYNTKKDWEDGHTHLDSFDMAKTVISNVIKHKIKYIPAPEIKLGTPQLQITSLDYSSYVGRIAVGRVNRGLRFVRSTVS